MKTTQHTADELVAILRLQHVPNIGDVLAKKLISHCGSPSAIFEDKKQNLLKIDAGRYKNYLDQYIKVPNSPDVPLWEIFTNYIKSNQFGK